MQALDEAMAGRRVEFAWVKGHSGHPLNEAADRLANGAAASWKAGGPPAPGPGFEGAVTRHPRARTPRRRTTTRTSSAVCDLTSCGTEPRSRILPSPVTCITSPGRRHE